MSVIYCYSWFIDQETLFVIFICFLYFNLELPCVGILAKKVVSWLNGLGLLTGIFKLIWSIKQKENLSGFGRVPIFDSPVIIEKHISTRGCATCENIIFYDHSWTKNRYPTKTNKYPLYIHVCILILNQKGQSMVTGILSTCSCYWL